LNLLDSVVLIEKAKKETAGKYSTSGTLHLADNALKASNARLQNHLKPA